MNAKKDDKKDPLEDASLIPPESPVDSLDEGWGTETEVVTRPSGEALDFKPGQAAILVFIERQNIKEFLKKVEGKEPEDAIYLQFFDGKRYLKMSEGFKFSSVKWIPGTFYLITCVGEVSMKGRNPMKDYEVRLLGKYGDHIQCPKLVHPEGKIALENRPIFSANYERLPYPLRDKETLEKFSTEQPLKLG